MAVSFFIRNKKAKIATLFARIRSKAKDIDIKASTLLEVDVAAWEKSQESAIKRKNYRNDKNNKEFFDKLDLIEKTLNNILDSDTNVTNELVNKRIYEIVYAEQIAAEKERQAAIEQAKRQVDIWKKIAGTAQKRKQQVETELIRQAEKEKMKADDTGRTESDSE